MPAQAKVSRWYFGGLASAGAACFTHPLDLIKVHLQTQQTSKKGIVLITAHIIKDNGLSGLYAGLSASLMRQLTYSMARFGIYEFIKQSVSEPGKNLSFGTLIGIAGISGAAGGYFGTPSDMVNVRMQNDMKLHVDHRRYYKHVIDGLLRVHREEGFMRLFAGWEMATARGLMMTIGQLAFYDGIKDILLRRCGMVDGLETHFTASLAAGAVATSMTQPIDVLKTRAMSAKPGDFKGVLHIIAHTAKGGPLAFFKGYIPAFVRLGPHTIITFLLLEQLRLNFGKDQIR